MFKALKSSYLASNIKALANLITRALSIALLIMEN